MRILIQNVRQATVSVADNIVGKIDKGQLLFVGFKEGDKIDVIDKMVDKLLKLRIFADADGKTNLSLSDVGGNLLVVSQFTLYADARKGNRPSFINAMKPAEAEEFFEATIKKFQMSFPQLQKGIFGADMQVMLINDGPFTLLLDSEELKYE